MKKFLCYKCIVCPYLDTGLDQKPCSECPTKTGTLKWINEEYEKWFKEQYDKARGAK